MSGGSARLAWLLAPLLCCAATAAPALDLVGSWHVLVHYRDDRAADPQAVSWEDRLWVFAREGDRLRWTDYPIVLFPDESSRFRELGTPRARRVEGAWEPGPKEEAAIRAGLAVNPRGSRSKALRAGADGRLESSSSAAGGSSSVLTYQERWSVSGLPDAPVFAMEDTLGGSSVRVTSMQGRTEWAAESAPSADVLRGRYERDGRLHGTFTMRRAGAARSSEAERPLRREDARAWLAREVGGDLADTPGLEEDLAPARGAPAARGEAGARLRARLRDLVRERGNDPDALAVEIERLAAEVERLYFAEGRSLAEIRDLLRAPPPAP